MLDQSDRLEIIHRWALRINYGQGKVLCILLHKEFHITTLAAQGVTLCTNSGIMCLDPRFQYLLPVPYCSPKPCLPWSKAKKKSVLNPINELKNMPALHWNLNWKLSSYLIMCQFVCVFKWQASREHRYMFYNVSDKKWQCFYNFICLWCTWQKIWSTDIIVPWCVFILYLTKNDKFGNLILWKFVCK